MSVIGNLGSKIVFSTSDTKILTFNDFSQKISSKWATHDIIGKKAKSEFLGPELRSITLKIILNATLGVKPTAIINTLEKMVETGEAQVLVIGNKRIGNYLWKITSMSESWDVIYTKGELVKASISLTLEEYI